MSRARVRAGEEIRARGAGFGKTEALGTDSYLVETVGWGGSQGWRGGLRAQGLARGIAQRNPDRLPARWRRSRARARPSLAVGAPELVFEVVVSTTAEDCTIQQ
jgi:hypothetical protein